MKVQNPFYIHCHSDQRTTMGCKMIALKLSGTDRIMTGIDMISFIRIFKRICTVSAVTFLTETCLQKS